MNKMIAFACVLAFALPLSAGADTPAAANKGIMKGYDAMMAAFKKNDEAGVAATMTEDYQGVGMDGKKVDKAGAMKMMKHYMDTTKKVNSAVFSISGLKVKGDKAMGMTTFKLDAVVTDPDGTMGGAKGKTHKLKMTEMANVTWTKVGGAWLTSKETPAGQPKMIVDGKPFNPMAAMPKKKSKM